MKLFILMIVLTITHAFAERFQVRIDSIDEGKDGQPHLILLSDGQVGFLNAAEEELLKDLRSLVQQQSTVEIELDSKHKVLSFSSVASNEPVTLEYTERSLMSYDPTIITPTQASKIFSSMRRDY